MTDMEFERDFGHLEYERKRILYLEGRIAEITKDHPLQQQERSVLADMIMTINGESAVIMDPERARTQYRCALDWLESTSRISPREWQELKKLPEREAKP